MLSRARGVERWDPWTGKIEPILFQPVAGGVELNFDLPASGSLLVFLSDEPRDPEPARRYRSVILEPAGQPEVHRVGPNVLTLDYVDVTAGGETLRDSYFYPAGQFAFRKNGLPRNPWDSAVQYKDEFISKKFPADSGFEAVYRFTVGEKVPDSLAVVVERADLYTITLNGSAVPAPSGWWLDKAFGKIDIRALAKVGENELKLKASPFSIYHEIEAAYLLGDFSLKPAEKGWVVAPAKPLGLGPWKDQGHPFFAEGVAYTEKFDLPAVEGRFVLQVPSWYGSLAKVRVNGKCAGIVECPPWELDVTKLLKAGENEIEVSVVGTLRNTLGPFHQGQIVGAAWPGMFQKGPEQGPPPGANYSTIGYGLFKPFVLRQER